MKPGNSAMLSAITLIGTALIQLIQINHFLLRQPQKTSSRENLSKIIIPALIILFALNLGMFFCVESKCGLLRQENFYMFMGWLILIAALRWVGIIPFKAKTNHPLSLIGFDLLPAWLAGSFYLRFFRDEWSGTGWIFGTMFLLLSFVLVIQVLRQNAIFRGWSGLLRIYSGIFLFLSALILSSGNSVVFIKMLKRVLPHF